jgi:hypothetical protein
MVSAIIRNATDEHSDFAHPDLMFIALPWLFYQESIPVGLVSASATQEHSSEAWPKTFNESLVIESKFSTKDEYDAEALFIHWKYEKSSAN